MKDHVARIRDSSSFPAFSFSTKPRLFYRRRRPTFSRPPAVARVCVSRPSCARASTADTSSAPRRNHETRRALSDSSCKTASGARLDRLLQTAGRCSRAPPRTTAEDRERRDRDRADGVVRPRRRRRRRRTTPSSASRSVRQPAPLVPPRRKTIFAFRSVRARRRRRRRRRAVRSGTRGGARDDVARSPFTTRGVRSRARRSARVSQRASVSAASTRAGASAATARATVKNNLRSPPEMKVLVDPATARFRDRKNQSNENVSMDHTDRLKCITIRSNIHILLRNEPYIPSSQQTHTPSLKRALCNHARHH